MAWLHNGQEAKNRSPGNGKQRLAKAQLASHIRQIIKRRRLTRVMAATLSADAASGQKDIVGASTIRAFIPANYPF